MRVNTLPCPVNPPSFMQGIIGYHVAEKPRSFGKSSEFPNQIVCREIRDLRREPVKTLPLAMNQYPLNTRSRIYLHGFITVALVCAIGHGDILFSPISDFTGHRLVAITLAISAIVIGPPIISSVIS